MSTTAAKSPNRHAHFPVNVDQEKKSQKILTIRYGKNQMALIRKRLRVEAWLYESLEALGKEHKRKNDQQRLEDGIENGAHTEIDIDIDQILDVEGDYDRRQWLQDKLKDCKAARDTIQIFIDEFLDRLKTL